MRRLSRLARVPAVFNAPGVVSTDVKTTEMFTPDWSLPAVVVSGWPGAAINTLFSDNLVRTYPL